MASPVTSATVSATVPLFKEQLLQFKVLNDPIHGHIELHPLIVRIIDTPQFQRLRYIHQLGACNYVYPGATNKRFEHCVGVCHLAGQLVRTIYTLQPDLGITEEDILCVEIAGLCHDLGHGPFSHLFDEKFMKVIQKDQEKKWVHEIGSVQMFDHMVKENNLMEEFRKHNLGEQDLQFIKALILGPCRYNGDGSETSTGRGRDKVFLYEIVANKRNGIDVDKWDYFARDAHNVGIASNFDHLRLMKFVRVLNVHGQKQICWREKECSNIYDMFHTRALLHRRVYQHKTSCAIETIKRYRLSEAVHDMAAYTKLTDHIYHHILYSSDEKLAPARHILERIEKRDIYKVVGQVKINVNIDMDDIEQSIISAYDDLQDKPEQKPTVQDIGIHIVTLDYGMKDRNPIDEVRFYRKENPDMPIKLDREEVLHIMPGRFRDRSLRVFSKKTDQASLDAVTACFQQWCLKQGLLNKETEWKNDE